jgi:methylated-DNA-[protein]-cysteine S-methyltransferase
VLQSSKVFHLPFFKNRLRAVLSTRGLLELCFEPGRPRLSPPCEPSRQLARLVHDYLAGNLAEGLEYPLDWDQLAHTPFQQRVWQQLQKVKAGQVVSYKELAKRSGYPRAARAVGSACARNPILLVIPCHRVVAQTGLGGFSGGGLQIKRQLLHLESSF